MSDDVIIQIQNIKKVFNIYEKPEDRLKQAVLSRINGKKYYREFVALDNINFEIRKGESVGLIGRNGAGKSTLLQIIAGTLNPTEGTVVLKGRVNALLELGSGFNPEFTGIENVFLNGSILGLNDDFIRGRLDDILSFADIGDFVYQPVKTYSSGMMVRLAFAVQVFLDPDILIVDEALSVGDVFFQRKCHKAIQRILDNGTSLIFVSHDTHTVVQYCQKTLFLKNGVQVFFGNSAMAASLYSKSDRLSINELTTEIEKREIEILQNRKEDGLAIGFQKPDSSRLEIGSFETIELLEFSFSGSTLGSDISFNINDLLTVRIRLKNNGKAESFIPALSINNRKNVSVYGKYAFQFPEIESEDLLVRKNSIVEYKFEVTLELIPDEYVVLLTAGAMQRNDVLNLKEMSLDYFAQNIIQEFVIELFSFRIKLPQIGLFLPFNGLVNLPSNLQITDLKGEKYEK